MAERGGAGPAVRSRPAGDGHPEPAADPEKVPTPDREGTGRRAGWLDEAGAVLVAKLTLGALAWGDVWYGEKTRNPWDPEQGSSGSSAGPGSATAGHHRVAVARVRVSRRRRAAP